MFRGPIRELLLEVGLASLGISIRVRSWCPFPGQTTRPVGKHALRSEFSILGERLWGDPGRGYDLARRTVLHKVSVRQIWSTTLVTLLVLAHSGWAYPHLYDYWAYLRKDGSQ